MDWHSSGMWHRWRVYYERIQWGAFVTYNNHHTYTPFQEGLFAWLRYLQLSKLTLHPYSVHLELSFPIHQQSSVHTQLLDSEKRMLRERRRRDVG